MCVCVLICSHASACTYVHIRVNVSTHDRANICMRVHTGSAVLLVVPGSSMLISFAGYCAVPTHLMEYYMLLNPSMPDSEQMLHGESGLSSRSRE